MRCSECGAELADGSKFCGECGAKIVQEALCPSCGTKVDTGSKFCPDCGAKLNGTVAVSEEESDSHERQQIDWDGPITKNVGSIPLTEIETQNVLAIVEDFRTKANPNRVVSIGLESERIDFEGKKEAFVALWKKRLDQLSDRNILEFFDLAAEHCPIGLIDYGKKGTGQRGTFITRVGIFYITDKYPTVIDGQMAGGYLPWEIFFKFAKVPKGKEYWFVNMEDLKTSKEVDLGEFDDKTDVDVKMFLTTATTGLSSEQIAEFLQSLKDAVDPKVDFKERFTEAILNVAVGNLKVQGGN